jgi:mono/diheme cytochrome c family protein
VLSLLVVTVLSTSGSLASAETRPVAAAGKALFTEHCSSCHGVAGEGFRSLYPPLAGSRILADELERLPCIIRNGLRGEIVVDGRVFNQVMPGNPRLSADDISRIITHMQAIWGEGNREIEVEAWLGQCE